jgi:hypothetical protein
MELTEPNTARTNETLQQFHERIIGQYPQEKIDAAVDFLRRQWTAAREALFAEGRALITADPENWFAPYHFSWGMAVRNELRSGGFGEDFWPIWNLDDIYVPLAERALLRGPLA